MKHFKYMALAGLLACSAAAVAKPVHVDLTYKNITPLTKQFNTKSCSALIENGSYIFDQNKSRSFKATPTHYVKNSHTIIRSMEGKDRVLVKLGRSIITTKTGKHTVDRISYVRIQPNGDAMGQLVLVGACKADFTSTRSHS